MVDANEPSETTPEVARKAEWKPGDRISFSASRKVYDRKLGSFESSFTYSSDVGKEEGLTGATKRVMAYVQKVIDYRLGLVEREIEESGLSEDNGDRRLDQLIAKQGSKAKPKDD